MDAKPNLKYQVVELDQDADGKAMRAAMGETLGRTSVPAIWIDGTFIGGCNDGPLGGGLVQLNESGKLVRPKGFPTKGDVLPHIPFSSMMVDALPLDVP